MNSRNSGHYFSEEAARRYHDYWKNIQFSENSIKKGKERFEIFTSSLKPGGRILDAGCGSAIYHSHFERAGFSLYGIDSSSEMLKIALEEHPNSIYRKMDITELDFDNNYFDGIWCSGVFLHLSPDMVSKTLNEFRRVLGKKECCSFPLEQTLQMFFVQKSPQREALWKSTIILKILS